MGLPTPVALNVELQLALPTTPWSHDDLSEQA
jgi:hypothetical protein